MGEQRTGEPTGSTATPPRGPEIGPYYDAAGLMSWLGMTQRAIRYRADTRQLLGVRTSDGHRLYPTWQFHEDGTTIPHLREVLDILAEGIDDPTTWAWWLRGSTRESLRGLTPWQWLAEGCDPVLALTEARAAATRWAH